MGSYRSVSPAFSRTNQGGPFSPIIEGNSLILSSDSFLFLNGANLGSADRVTMTPAPITNDLKIYLQIYFKNGIFEKKEVIAGTDWWDTYPNTVKYEGNEEKIHKQTSLFIPIFSVVFGVAGTYANISGVGNITIYRHIYNNLMLMQTCKYFFLLPAPSAPGLA